MAGTLGSLIVSLGLDAAQFTSGLTRSEFQAKRFADSLDRQFKSVARTIAGLGIGAAIGVWVKDTIASASALNDFADQTGSSVEALSKLSNQAKISGTDFSTLQGLVLKLSAGMAGADDESSNVGRALRALGVDAKDPAEALQQIALKLAKYEDGIGKAAIARDLFGKGGPAFLATLKDIANLSDVAATTTAKQAEEAEKLEQALRRLSVESTTFKNALLSEVVPALINTIEQMREGARIAGGFWSALFKFGVGISPFGDVGEKLRDINKQIAALENRPVKLFNSFGVDKGTLDTLKQQREFLQLQQRQQALAGSAALGDTRDARDLRLQQKPLLDYTGGKDKAASVRAAAKEVDEFARALQRLREAEAEAGLELRGAFSTEPITGAQRALERLSQTDVFAKFTASQKEQLIAGYKAVEQLERQTIAAREYRQETEKQIRAAEQLAETQQRARDAITKVIGDYANANDIFEREIALIGQDDVAHQKLQATLEYEKLVKQAVAAEDMAALDILDEQYKKRLQLIDTFAAATDSLKRVNEVRAAFTDGFSNAFTDLITGAKSFGDAIKSMERSIVQSLANIASRNIADAIFGKSGGGGADWITKIAGMFAGSLGGGGLTSTGGGFGEHFAAGGVSRGGMAMVGENGPEGVYLPRGANVVPNNVLQGMRAQKANNITIQQTVNVLPGASTKTAAQAAAMAGSQVSRAVSRVG